MVKQVPDKMRMTLKSARELNGLSIADAAKAIGVSDGAVTSYEKGLSFPDTITLKKIENVYGVDYNRLHFLNLDYGLTGND